VESVAEDVTEDEEAQLRRRERERRGVREDQAA
jgi:hypothetical protein